MPPASTPLAKSCLRYSAHTFGDRIMLGGGQGKWALWQFCPTTEESLKMHWKDWAGIFDNELTRRTP
jgi:hypothetical protein